MLESGYIGDAAYPFGHSVSHYETGYYKEMFEKVKQLTEFA
ncbi:hypothetical protein MFLO_09697 [Listeria floridensis FSL S10-1187]|uniref:Uncharacterized protein n=1 Tax=Listeria floridensis FSL S10-1187 TaxID=1265817 RepID=A0ABN0RE91_9LIST|nr:hypothetical protein [Listeria floridensis]EUJ30959.1 hypothetical protein MFLO_09697 [Listeria floridensis FSL S10-1187]